MKSQKSRSEEKVVSFSSASLFPARKWEAVTQGGTREMTTQCAGEPRELVWSKAGRTNETIGAFQLH